MKRLVLLVMLLIIVGFMAPGNAGADPVKIKVRMEGVRKVELTRTSKGKLVYRLENNGGEVKELPPEEFSELLYSRFEGRPFLFRLFNVSSWGGVAWVCLGFAGQLLFSGRMVVQWVVSEKKKRSVVPVAFWWMSLGGASMLLVYFLWRKDIVGVLGQSAGWAIYVRNLWLIYRPFGREAA